MNRIAVRGSMVWGSALWGVALFFCLFPTLFFPPHRDAATFWLLGDAINHGRMPYTAVWDLKPPGIYLLYALPARFGATEMASWTAVRMFDLLLLGAGAWLVGAIASRLLSPGLRGVAALWFIALYLASTLNSLAQAEAWANPFWLLGWWLLLGPESPREGQEKLGFTVRLSAFFWSGFFTALAFSCKPTSAAPTLGVLAIACFFLRREKVPVLKLALLWWVGFLLPLVAMVLWLQRDGAWSAFVDIQRLFVSPYVAAARDPFIGHVTVVLVLVATYMVRFSLAATLAILGVLSRESWPNRARSVLYAALFSAAVALWVQNRVFEYHLQILLPMAALLITAGSAALVRLIPGVARFKNGVLLAVPLLWLLWLRKPVILAAPLYATGHLSRAEWFRKLESQALDKTREIPVEEAGIWMRQRSRPGDTLMVWGFASELYMWSGLPPSQRFAFLPAIGAKYSPPQWKAEFLANTQRRPPRFFVIMRGERLGWLGVKGGTSESALHNWPALHDWFYLHYRRVKVWPSVAIWELQKG